MIQLVLIIYSKELLVEFSTWTATFQGTVCMIEEFTISYNAALGTISYGLLASDSANNKFKRFYPDVFVGIREQLFKTARIYYSFKSIFGTTIR